MTQTVLDDLTQAPYTAPYVPEEDETLESQWHGAQIMLSVQTVNWRYRGREDYYAVGNLMIAFRPEHGGHLKHRGPDFMLVYGVARQPMRDKWVVEAEGGRYPDVIIEMLSPSTEAYDLTEKKELFERVFHTAEYFCCGIHGTSLRGWRLRDGRYVVIEPDARGWLWSEQMGAWLGIVAGEFDGQLGRWLRFFEADGTPWPLPGEAEAARADAEWARAEAEWERAEAEATRAEVEATRAEIERIKREQAEAEVVRLRAELARLRASE